MSSWSTMSTKKSSKGTKNRQEILKLGAEFRVRGRNKRGKPYETEKELSKVMDLAEDSP